MNRLLFVCLSLGLFAHITSAAKFPSGWKKCPKKNNEACIKETMHIVIKDTKNGFKEYGIIPLDPLHFDRMELNQGGNSPVNINLTFSNLDIIGPSRIKINRAIVDWDKHNLVFDVDVVDGPAFLLGDYVGSGKVLILPFRGKGKANITLEDLSVTLTLKGSEVTKNGKKYFHVDEGQFYIKPKNTKLHLENLFDGNPSLGDNMNKFMNENNHEIISELNATIAAAIGAGVKEIANQFFQRVPMTELYT